MENTPVADETALPPKNILFQVTPVSKVLAAVLFIALPFIGFWIGINYSKNNTDFSPTEVSPTYYSAPDNLKPEAPKSSLVPAELGPELVDQSSLSDITGPFSKSSSAIYFESSVGVIGENREPVTELFQIIDADRSTFRNLSQKLFFPDNSKLGNTITSASFYGDKNRVYFEQTTVTDCVERLIGSGYQNEYGLGLVTKNELFTITNADPDSFTVDNVIVDPTTLPAYEDFSETYVTITTAHDKNQNYTVHQRVEPLECKKTSDEDRYPYISSTITVETPVTVSN